MIAYRTLCFVSFSFLFFACGSKAETKKEEKAITEEEKIQMRYDHADMVLSFDKEKVLLLSIIKGVEEETAKSILRDYLIYDLDSFVEEDNSKAKKVILEISEKHSLPVSKVASLIFSYKYEMITKEEVEESVIERIEQSRYEDYEEETPEY